MTTFDRASTKSSIESAGLVGTAERPFLTPKMASEGTTKVPSLDEFDAEIDIYKVYTILQKTPFCDNFNKRFESSPLPTCNADKINLG